MLNEDLLIIDTETTGLRSDAEVVEIGIVNYLGEPVYHEYFKPTKTMGSDVISVHKITNEFLADKPSYNQDAHDKLMDLIEGKSVWAYNGPFDSRLLFQTCKFHGVETPRKWYFNCAMQRFNQLYNSQGKWMSLVNACKHLSIDISDLAAHSAINDCIITHRLMTEIKKNMG